MTVGVLTVESQETVPAGFVEAPPGDVQLSDKLIPVFKQQEAGTLPQTALPCCFTRGQVDVGKLKNKLVQDAGTVWSEEEHARTNVRITRPSHDGWGIRKVVLIFCDDFLKRVYHFPWWQDPDWRACVEPIFQAIGVPTHKVVRCLLASMPPGCVIPVHHDTGYWVQHTHRVHVPVVTEPSHIEFRVGPDAEHMQKFWCNEGRVLELNNQAKHAVTNHWDQHRVHLIFDYVDDYPINTRQLRPGEVLHQTRRTLDLDDAPREGPTPAFIVIGAQKCGTTSMYEYLCQHPLVLRGRRRETHFFDWRWQHKLTSADKQKAFYHRFFFADVLKQHPSLVTGESTPSYLLHSDVVIPRMRAVAPEAKLIVMLRDPAKRAYSHYCMTQDQDGTPEQLQARGASSWRGKSFENVVAAEMAQLRDLGIGPDSPPEEFAQKYLPLCPMGHGGHSLLARGLYALQLSPWLAAYPKGQVEVVILEDLAQGPEALQSIMDRVFHHVGLPPSPVEDKSVQNSRRNPPACSATMTALYEFYKPHNQRLAEFLGRALPWQEAAAPESVSSQS